MLRHLAFAALIALVPTLALADSFAIVGPTPPTSDNSKRLATTEWVNNFFATGLPLASGKIFVGSAGNVATAQTPSGDCTLSASGVITCTQSAGAFTVNGLLTVTGNLSVGGSIIDGNGILATNIVAPATPSAGTTRIYVDSTTKVLTFKNDAGTVGNAVVPSTCAANQFGISVSAAGVFSCAQPSVSNISGFGTGVATALGVNVATAGSFVVNGGALGTPSSGNGSNLTALNATQLTAGTVPAARTSGHQNGTATNDNGAAGEIGEYICTLVTNGGSPTLCNTNSNVLINATTGNPVNIASMSLTAGDWDVGANIDTVMGGTTDVTQILAWTSTTSATVPTAPNNGAFLGLNYPGASHIGFNDHFPVGQQRISLASTTTVYFSARVNFTVSTAQLYGIAWARRAR